MKLIAIKSFIAQVRQEIFKITWPARKDTITTTIIVLMVVISFSIFFLLIDLGAHKAIQAILKFGR